MVGIEGGKKRKWIGAKARIKEVGGQVTYDYGYRMYYYFLIRENVNGREV